MPRLNKFFEYLDAFKKLDFIFLISTSVISFGYGQLNSFLIDEAECVFQDLFFKLVFGFIHGNSAEPFLPE